MVRFLIIVQGISGALMTPTSRLIVLEKTPASQLLKMVSYLIWPALIAPAIAPVIGGFIITYWSWQWIFLINVPIGLIIVLIGIKLINTDQVNKRATFDLLGFVELAFSSGIILVGAEIATHGENYWFSALGLIVLGVTLGFIVFNHLKKTANPLFSLDALKITSSTLAQGMGISIITAVVNLLQNFFSITTAYELWFIFLGLLMLFPAIEVLFLPKNIGHATID
ncbi:MFS transporter [Clostridium estertheticum]|uniref:MFS transporter n=1 Tax=Clostridium estertheticum TaxID=238834 RepID=UPI0024C7A600|nr:MFS transporter [Clostridium estertheticum]